MQQHTDRGIAVQAVGQAGSQVLKAAPHAVRRH